MGLTREVYRKIKGYNREQMEHYLDRVFSSGYEAGRKSVLNPAKPEDKGEKDGEDALG